ncbi:MAG: hypothetical protein M1833_001836 [Piccolia ochrophora]|nr:MAG: hypothetical protein M1833_001836 [Piccolia ochrophora]
MFSSKLFRAVPKPPSSAFLLARRTAERGRIRGLHGSRPSLRATPEARPEPNRQTSRVDATSEVLQQTDTKDNNLLSPVHVPEDPHGVLKETHPATQILRNSAIVIQRQLEMMNVFMYAITSYGLGICQSDASSGFEQANKYVIMDPQGNHLGFMAEEERGLGNVMARQWFRTHRSFTTHVFDKNQVEVLRFNRPFSWISSRIQVYDPVEPQTASPISTTLQNTNSQALTSQVDPTSAHVSSLALSEMRVIGEAQQSWAPLRRKYNLFLFRKSPNPEHDMGTREPSSSDIRLSESQELQAAALGNDSGAYNQFAYVDEPFLSWDFSLLTADNRLIGSVNRNFAGFAREIFTDTGVYALRMDAAGLADEPRHLISQTGKSATAEQSSSRAGMTLDERALMLATAVSVDFDYFSRHSGATGPGFMPLWLPGMGGGAAEGGVAAGAEAEAEAGAGSVIPRGAERGVVGPEGVGGSVGAIAGYESMRNHTNEPSPVAGDAPSDGGASQQLPRQDDQQEPLWGTESDPWHGGQGQGSNPWGGGQGGQGPPSNGGQDWGGDSGGGGGDGGGFDPSDWF